MYKRIAAIMLTMLPSVAMADGGQNYAKITEVTTIYQDRFVDRYETQCGNVEVPVYGSVRGGSTGDVLAGAIIGGAIGNQFGSGSGKDAMTVLGAILGANAGSNATRNAVVGYRLEQRCHQVRYTVNEPVVSHYRIRYVFNGQVYEQETTRRYEKGQRVRVEPILK